MARQQKARATAGRLSRRRLMQMAGAGGAGLAASAISCGSRGRQTTPSGAATGSGFRTRAFVDNQTAWSAFLAGQIDVTLLDGPASKTYITQQPTGYQPAWGPDDTIGAFMYPNTKVKPMDDQRVTRALRLLTDHDEWRRPVSRKTSRSSSP